ncbi:MAG TPA: monofunctional biosynthetic peptidoglycan transglycosylase [Saprospiraceae bacterium]|nr:monofunctional biosynthetic peptidoglycan transglycosylase [Saprospiraceae bacterium]
MAEEQNKPEKDAAAKPKSSILWLIYKWFAIAVLVGFTFTLALVAIYRVLPVPVTPLMIIRLFEQAGDEKRSLRLYKDWEPLSDITPALQLAVVCAEDQQFTAHAGFDFEAIEKALKHNKRYRRKRGASTISQQTAKNVFLYPNRSWIRKGLEVYFTILIESYWSKKRIMEVYLNVIELGDGIYGAEAASNYFYKKNAAKIKAEEAALLAAVLPNPLRYKVNRPGTYIQNRKSWIYNQMLQWDMKLDYGKRDYEKRN